MKAFVVEKEQLLHNMQIIRAHAGDAVVWAVLKGNGYGLGAVPMAGLLREVGIDHFAVTNVREAVELREAGFEDNPIRMLRQTQDEAEINALLDLKVILTVGSTEAAVAVNAIAAERAAMARVHLKVDTGMGRYGFVPADIASLLKVYEYQKSIVMEGV